METEETAPSFFSDPLGWLMNKAAELGKRHREEVEEWAEHKAHQNIEKYLNDNPELATRAKANIDIGLTSGTISPAVYEMLASVEARRINAQNKLRQKVNELNLKGGVFDLIIE